MTGIFLGPKPFGSEVSIKQLSIVLFRVPSFVTVSIYCNLMNDSLLLNTNETWILTTSQRLHLLEVNRTK